MEQKTGHNPCFNRITFAIAEAKASKDLKTLSQSLF